MSFPMNRRDFLSLCGLAAGSCIIPVRLARAIRDTCVLGGQSYFVNAPAAGSVLYAVQNTFHEFTFRLGEEVSPPTWREYLEESQGIDPRDPEAVKVWQREQLCCEPGEEEEIAFDDRIDGWALDQWLEWDYSLRDGPEAQAYRYLEDLPLDDGKERGAGRPLGDLRFIEGDRPGSNFTYVQAPDHATLACLQHRLNELGEGIRIEIQDER